jgi:hypothetical protein
MGKVSVLLTPAEESRFSSYCSERGFKKSTLIARLIRDHLDHETYPIQAPLFSEDVRAARESTATVQPRTK